MRLSSETIFVIVGILNDYKKNEHYGPSNTLKKFKYSQRHDRRHHTQIPSTSRQSNTFNVKTDI